MNLLSSMASEWLLIFLLFVDAAFSYLLTKFARYCELKTPCPLCSRLDHVFGNEKLEFYRNLLCSSHRMEVSSLISCQIHGKLAGACGMCEECLMSFSMKNKLNSESYRLLVGKLGFDYNQCGFLSSFSNKNIILGSLSTKTCSCCNKKWRARPNAQRLLQPTLAGLGSIKTNNKALVGLGSIKSNNKPPLPHLPSRSHLSHRDSFKKIRDKISGPITPRRLGNTGVDPLSHVGYSALKITSDSESEFPFSDDDDDRSSVICENTDTKDVLAIHHSAILSKVHPDNLNPFKQTQQTSNPGPSLLDQYDQLDVREPRDVECLTFDDVKGHEALPHNSSLFALSKLVSPNDIPPSSNVMEIPVGISPDKLDIIGTSDVGHISVIKHEVSELMNTTTATGFKTDPVLNDIAPSMSNDVGPSDECRLVDNNKGREVPHMVSELAVVTDSAKVHDQIVSAPAIGPSLNGTSLEVHDNHDELLKSDASSSNGILVLQKSVLLVRNDSSYESLDGSTISEIDGESIVDTLKRQVDHDKKRIGALYKELEEERNAAEIAANQAMAMITRLQEEKALLHMEALQYLRMMEEQAEYDMEALEKANDLLAEREKETQDLEAELEFYKNHVSDEEMVESLPGETNPQKVDNTRIDNNGVPQIKSIANMHFASMSKLKDIKTSLLDIEGEKQYISQYLKKLESKLHQVSGNGTPNGERQTDHQKQENGLSMPNDLSALNGRLSTRDGSDVSIEDNSSAIKENNHFDSDWEESSIQGGYIDLNDLHREISDLNSRLEAIEDRDFLKHAFNSLRCGTEGLQFIQEIAHNLQELRKIGIENRCLSIP
ncbi:putative myosin-binding protein 4 [Camellia lanceoleosa]|uniref:Myosin-binding protein 4 n=1 Tax=Camellia lanceoleosa TaxID=1840588 RepID=A0ACC0F2U8_9ERIC|nr:putative myosin-binding protein 4 [Camellia lanceoleosa]